MAGGKLYNYWYWYFLDWDDLGWQQVNALYAKDLVIGALEEAERLGGRDSNELYAEAEVRENGTRTELRSWLTLEVVPEDIGDRFDNVADLICDECDALCEQFGWDDPEATLVTILRKDVDEPWMPGRAGYYRDKEPYEKICLPYSVIADEDQLMHAIRHEFMHVITWNFSRAQAFRWVMEGFSTYADRTLDSARWRAFQSGSEKWLSPKKLDKVLSMDNRIETAERQLAAGYAQACFIVRFLNYRFGKARVEEFLHELGHSAIWKVCFSPTDAALRYMFGRSERKVFAEARDWVRANPVPSA